MRLYLLILASLSPIGWAPALAQTTNAEWFGAMAVECAAPALEGRSRIAISGPSARPYLGAALATWALSSGITPFLAGQPANDAAASGEGSADGERAPDRDGSAAGDGNPAARANSQEAAPPAILAITAEAAQVVYRRAGRRHLERTLAQTLRIQIIEADGSLGYDTVCPAERSDRIPRASVASVEHSAWPETQGPLPPGSWRARYLEPVVVTAATAVATYLFFSLRSRRSQDGG